MKPRVLVVDFFGGLAALVVDVLHAQGFHACQAPTSAAALHRAVDCHHQVAVLDYHTEESESLGRALRARGCAVVAVAGVELDRQRAVGASVFLGKPFNSAQLVAAIRKAMELPKME
jgi:DNA-binding response OmpR family regulator